MCRRGNNYNMPALHLGTLTSRLASGGRLEIDGGNPYRAGEPGDIISHAHHDPSLEPLQWSIRLWLYQPA